MVIYFYPISSPSDNYDLLLYSFLKHDQKILLNGYYTRYHIWKKQKPPKFKGWKRRKGAVESYDLFIKVTFIIDNERGDYKTEALFFKNTSLPTKCLQKDIGIWNIIMGAWGKNLGHSLILILISSWKIIYHTF